MKNQTADWYALSAHRAMTVANELIYASIPFTCMPYPDDVYRFDIKNGIRLPLSVGQILFSPESRPYDDAVLMEKDRFIGS